LQWPSRLEVGAHQAEGKLNGKQVLRIMQAKN
jgi:hypothetical protein